MFVAKKEINEISVNYFFSNFAKPLTAVLLTSTSLTTRNVFYTHTEKFFVTVTSVLDFRPLKIVNKQRQQQRQQQLQQQQQQQRLDQRQQQQQHTAHMKQLQVGVRSGLVLCQNYLINQIINI